MLRSSITGAKCMSCGARFCCRRTGVVRSMLPEEQYDELIEAAGQDALETARAVRLALAIIDELWADYLAECRGTEGRHPLGFVGRPRPALRVSDRRAREIYDDFHARLKEILPARLRPPRFVHGAHPFSEPRTLGARRDVDLRHHRPAVRTAGRTHRERNPA